MFLDKAEIYVKAGNGGNGIVSFHREKYVAQGGPDGGDGGKGGDIIFKIDEGKNTLLEFKRRRKFAAPNGQDGKSSKMYGKSAENIYISVPPGTLIRDADTGRIIKDMTECGDFIAAKGGKGGWGNRHFATASRQTPNFAKNGLPGEEKKLILELKMLAEVGLIGYPNVGKSSILNIVSMARPKIANYHFTTLSPNLGVVSVDDDFAFVMADIPGLIEGASDGLGLGHDFLRHIERCRLLVHVVDISGSEGRDPIEDIETINRELAKYSEELIDRPQIIAANKIDLLEYDMGDGDIVGRDAPGAPLTVDCGASGKPRPTQTEALAEFESYAKNNKTADKAAGIFINISAAPGVFWYDPVCIRPVPALRDRRYDWLFP